MPYCSDCGSKIESSESFCANCGQQQQPEVSVTPGRKPRKVWLVVGLAVVFLVILGVVIAGEVGEVGIYGIYVDPELGAYYLEIRRDGRVDISYKGEVITGKWEWVVRGEKIRLEVEGDVAEGQIDGDRIIVRDQGGRIRVIWERK